MILLLMLDKHTLEDQHISEQYKCFCDVCEDGIMTPCVTPCIIIIMIMIIMIIIIVVGWNSPSSYPGFSNLSKSLEGH